MKHSLLIALGLFLAIPRVWAADAPAASASDFLTTLQAKLDHVARRANQPTSTGSSVAGLRGSKQESKSKQLYWKGRSTENPVSIDEVKLFRTGVEQARAGNIADANATLQSFLDKYPQSGLKPDVEETIKVLSTPS